MDDQWDVGDLADVLQRATERVQAPGLAGAAWAEGQRRRRRRTAVVTGVVAASVVAVVGLVSVVAPESRLDPAPEIPAVSPSPPSSTLTTAPAPRPTGVQDIWNPATLVDAPVRASVLPERLDPPGDAPSLGDDPASSVVVAWPEPGRDLRLLGTDGRWRTVHGTADAVSGSTRDVVQPVLQHDGRRVAMATDAGILVVDVTTGRSSTIPWPEALGPPWETAPELRWSALDGHTAVAVLDWRGTWLVDLDGRAQKAPYESEYGLGLAFDPDGTVVQKRWEQQDLTLWQDGAATHRSTFGQWGERLVAGHGLVALTGGGNGLPGDGGPMVVDALTGGVVAYAPMRDPQSLYSDNGHLTALGFLDAETALFLLGPPDFSTTESEAGSWHLATWDLRSGGFQRLTSGPQAMHGIAVAPGTLVGE